MFIYLSVNSCPYLTYHPLETVYNLPFVNTSMKISLTPKLAYIIGLWKARRTSEGIGVAGNQYIREIFMREAFAIKLAEADKIQLDEDKVFFYHSAYRKFFDDVVANELDRFAHKNEFSSNYIAGIFDGCGGFIEVNKQRFLFLAKASKADEMMFLRLGFRAKKEGGKLVVINSPELLSFITPHLKFLGTTSNMNSSENRPARGSPRAIPRARGQDAPQ